MYLRNTLSLKVAFFLIASFLIIFLVIPVFSVFYAAFIDPYTGNFTLVNFLDFFKNQLFIESFFNSFYVAIMSVLLSTVFALPLSYFTTRFQFRGSIIIQSLGFIPLIMPPFVGAVALKLLFGTNGTVNLFLNKYIGFKIPFMEGLNGVIFAEAIHYFPFILINLVASLNNIDKSMEESAQNLGSSGFNLFRKIVLPLSMPGYVAGASLVFLKVFDDLGTPLLLDINNMLAPQAYLRISAIGIDDPMGYVMAVILIVTSLAAMWIAKMALAGKDYSMLQKGGGGLAKRKLNVKEKIMAYGVIIFILLIVLAPHIGLALLSFGTIWSFSYFPDAYTLNHYKEIFETSNFIKNTFLYCSIAAFIDVLLGVLISYIVLRTSIKWREFLDYTAMAALAIPGLALGIGYLRTFYQFNIPFTDKPLASWWFIIVIALTIRRLPYALRACNAALTQISIYLEESAEVLSATRYVILKKIVVPLMLAGILAGFITSFATATVELSATIMLVSNDIDAPLSYAIYSYMQTAAGRGPGAALGVIAVVIVGIGTYVSQRIIERKQNEKLINVN